MLLYNIYFYNEYVDCADSGYCQSPFFKIKRLTFVKQNDIFRLTDVELQERENDDFKQELMDNYGEAMGAAIYYDAVVSHARRGDWLEQKYGCHNAWKNGG